MSGEMRWQDWINVLLGVVLFITPFVFGDTSQTAAAWTAYVGGVLLFVFGAGSLLFRWNPTIEYLPLIEGVLLFLAPWVLGFSGITAMAWSAWVTWSQVTSRRRVPGGFTSGIRFNSSGCPQTISFDMWM